MRVLLLFCLLSLPLFADWNEIRSPHFTVVTDAGTRKGQEVANYFEQMRYVFENQMPNLKLDIGKDILIFAVRNERSLAELIPTTVGGKSRSFGGVFFPGQLRNHIVVRTDMGSFGYQTIIHEYTHMIISNSSARIPLWLNEGLAEFFGAMEILSDRVNIGRVNDNAAILRYTPFMPFDVLASMDQTSKWYNEDAPANIFYAQAWLLTHYAMMSEEGRAQGYLNQLIKLNDQEVSPVEAMQTVFGSLEDLDKKLKQYIKKNRYPYYTIKTKLKLEKEKFPAVPLSVNQAQAYRAVLRVGNMAGPVSEADLTALMAAKDEPGLALNLGLALFYLKRHPESQALMRSLALPGAHWLAHFLVGINDQVPGEERIGHLEEVLRLNTRCAPAAYELAYLLIERDPNRALTLAHQALAAKPNYFGSRLLLGQLMVRLKRYQEALEVGRHAHFLAADEGERALVKSRVTGPAERALNGELLPEMSVDYIQYADQVGKVRLMTVGYSRNQFYETPLLRAIWTYNSDEITAQLSQPNAVKERSMFGETPLHLAAERGDLELAQTLLAQGAELEARDAAQWTPLLVATAENNSELAQALIAAGASVKAVNELGQSSLMWACLNEDTALVTQMLKHAPDLNQKDNDGKSALDYVDGKSTSMLGLMHAHKAIAGKGSLDKAERRARSAERQQAMRRVYAEKTGLEDSGSSVKVVDEAAFTSDKTDLTALCNKAVDALVDENHDKVHRLLDQVLAKDPHFEPALDLYVHLLCSEGKIEEAETYLQRYTDSATNKSNLGERYFQVAKRLMQADMDGDMGRRAANYLNLAWEWTEGKIPLIQYKLGDLYLMFGAEKQALEAYNRYIETGDTSNWMFMAKDQVEVLKRSLAKAK